MVKILIYKEHFSDERGWRYHDYKSNFETWFQNKFNKNYDVISKDTKDHDGNHEDGKKKSNNEGD